MGWVETLAGAGALYSAFKGNSSNSTTNSSQAVSGEESTSAGEIALLDEAMTELNNSATAINETTTGSAATTSDQKTQGTERSTSKDRTSGVESKTGSSQQLGSETSRSDNNLTQQNYERALSEQQTQDTRDSRVTSSSLSADLTGQLESVVSDALSLRKGGSFQAGQDALTQQLGALSGGNGFDSQSFVNGIVAQADARLQQDLESDINANASAIGGTAAGNSMAALLQSRLQNDAAANLAGVRSAAMGQAEQIQAGRTAQIGSLADSATRGIVDMVGSLKGAQTTQIGTESGVATSQDQSSVRGDVTSTEKGSVSSDSSISNQYKDKSKIDQTTTGSNKVDSSQSSSTKEKGKTSQSTKSDETTTESNTKDTSTQQLNAATSNRDYDQNTTSSSSTKSNSKDPFGAVLELINGSRSNA